MEGEAGGGRRCAAVGQALAPGSGGGSRRVAAPIKRRPERRAAAAMAWGCALWLALAGGVLLALLRRWLRAEGDLTVLWAEWRGKKPGKAAPCVWGGFWGAG